MKVHRDGRVVLTKHEWDEMRLRRWNTFPGHRRCAKCNVAFHEMWQMQMDHIKPKGMGGGKRDDRDENLQPVCYLCNFLKGSKRE